MIFDPIPPRLGSGSGKPEPLSRIERIPSLPRTWSETRSSLALPCLATAVAALVNGLAKEPGGPQGFVKWNQGRTRGGHVQKVQKHFSEIVRLLRTARDANDGNSVSGFPFPTEIIGQSHATGGISLHGVNAAVGRASAGCHDGPGLGSQSIDPVAGQDWLAGFFAGAEGGPISFRLVVLVRNRAFHDKYERIEFSCGCVAEELHELVAVFVGEKGIMKMNLGNPGECAENDVLDARLTRAGHSDGVAVASEPGGEPQDVHLGEGFTPTWSITRRRSELRHQSLSNEWAPVRILPEIQPVDC